MKNRKCFIFVVHFKLDVDVMTLELMCLYTNSAIFFTSMIYFNETLNANTLVKNLPQDDEVLRSSAKLIVKWDAECFEIFIINCRFNFPTFSFCSLSHWMVLVHLSDGIVGKCAAIHCFTIHSHSLRWEKITERKFCVIYVCVHCALYNMWPLNPDLVANLTQLKNVTITE